jgi:hypothetical protein
MLRKTRRRGGFGYQDDVVGVELVGATGGVSASADAGAAGFLRGRPRWPGATRRLAVWARLAMKLAPPNAH